MPKENYRTLHTPAAAEDLADENERRYRQLLKEMKAMEQAMRSQIRRNEQNEQRITELNRRIQELAERNERLTSGPSAGLEDRNGESAEQSSPDRQPPVEKGTVPEFPNRGAEEPPYTEEAKDEPGRGHSVKRRLWVSAAVLVILIVAIGLGWGIRQVSDGAQSVTVKNEETATDTVKNKETAVESGKNVMATDYHLTADSVWGDSSLKRSEIVTVTFLDTQSEAPEDARDVSEEGDGSVLAWTEKSGDYYDLYVAGEGGVAAGTSCAYLFRGFSNLKTVEWNANFYTSGVTNMRSMFSGCSSLTSLDVSGFDTSEVKNMAFMFYNCSSLTSLDVSGFDTSKVRDMKYMFSACSSLTSLDVSGFDTSRVTRVKENSHINVRKYLSYLVCA